MSKEKTSDGVAGVSFLVKKLFTKEDNLNLHKTLGLLCVISFLHRSVDTPTFPLPSLNLSVKSVGTSFWGVKRERITRGTRGKGGCGGTRER
jgi:hypothetical protein